MINYKRRWDTCPVSSFWHSQINIFNQYTRNLYAAKFEPPNSNIQCYNSESGLSV